MSISSCCYLSVFSSVCIKTWLTRVYDVPFWYSGSHLFYQECIRTLLVLHKTVNSCWPKSYGKKDMENMKNHGMVCPPPQNQKEDKNLQDPTIITFHHFLRTLGVFRRLLFRCYLSLHTFSFLYTALLRPCDCLQYATAVWDDCSSHDSHSLERIQLSLARSALSLHSHSSALTLPKMSLLRTLGWPTLAWRWRRRSKLLLFWQLVHGLGPPCLQEKLSSASSRCKYSLQNPKCMEVPLCSTSAHLSSFLPSCSILWNTLPASVISCSSLSSFGSSLDSLFVDSKFSFGLPP